MKHFALLFSASALVTSTRSIYGRPKFLEIPVLFLLRFLGAGIGFFGLLQDHDGWSMLINSYSDFSVWTSKDFSLKIKRVSVIGIQNAHPLTILSA